MSTSQAVVIVIATGLAAAGTLVALLVDVRAHGSRPRLDRLWLVVPAIGLATLVAATWAG